MAVVRLSRWRLYFYIRKGKGGGVGLGTLSNGDKLTSPTYDTIRYIRYDIIVQCEQMVLMRKSLSGMPEAIDVND